MERENDNPSKLVVNFGVGWFLAGGDTVTGANWSKSWRLQMRRGRVGKKCKTKEERSEGEFSDDSADP